MLELASRLVPLLERGVPVALATSIDVIGSAPHLAGTSMAVTVDGVDGSVSNGCVESAALADCRAVLAGAPPRVTRYGFGDAAAAAAGLSCGGELDVLVHPLPPTALPALRAVAAGGAGVLALVTAGPDGWVGRVLDDAALRESAAPLGVGVDRLVGAVAARAATARPGPVDLDCGDTVLRLFVDVAAPPRRVVLVGATETALALAAAAGAVGDAVVVCDPRADFLPPGRFPGAQQHIGRPDVVLAGLGLTPADAVCVLSHDEDLDPLALAVALESPAGYVGALGSRSTVARRVERLRLLGVADDAVARLHAPIGLHLGASTPAETAVSILAELIAVRAGASGTPLRAGSGPIHLPSPQREPASGPPAPPPLPRGLPRAGLPLPTRVATPDTLFAQNRVRSGNPAAGGGALDGTMTTRPGDVE